MMWPNYFLLQPVLSPSVLEFLIRNEKKLPPEFTMAENWTEIQVGWYLVEIGGLDMSLVMKS